MQKRDKRDSKSHSEDPGTEHKSDIKTDNDAETDENAEGGGFTDKEENSQVSSETDKVKEMEQKNQELNDKYLRLYSEFDNYRRRTVKEKSDIIKTAGEDIFKALLPVIDDFERAMKANEKIEDIAAIKEGVQLIYNKLKNTVQQKGLTPFESIGSAFDADTMEAITHIPAADESQKGKVIDEVEKGYKLGDKVIRYAKVVVAQ
jgi:molecular chaperone GrpE